MPTGLPDLLVRQRVADAVHRAVCEFTRSDGFGLCYLYALGGWFLGREILKRSYTLQAGVLRILANPPDGWLTMTAYPDGLSRGEFHCWFGLSDANAQPAEIVDLASRHHRRWAGRIQEVQPAVSLQWTEDPPDFVWSAPPFPAWMGLIADRELTRAYRQSVQRNAAGLAPFYHRVERCFESTS